MWCLIPGTHCWTRAAIAAEYRTRGGKCESLLQVVEESHKEWVRGVAMWQGASLYSLRWVTSLMSLVGVVCVCEVLCVLCADSGRLVRTG